MTLLRFVIYLLGMNVLAVVLVLIITVLVLLITRELFPGFGSAKATAGDGKWFTLEELGEYKGDFDEENEDPLYVAVDGNVYDLSPARSMYGPGGPYYVFAGCDASYALAITSLSEDDVNKPINTLTERQIDRMKEWKQMYDRKYKVVGHLAKLK